MPKPQPRRDPAPSRRSNWDKSDRRSRLPPDWDKIRRRILKRDSPNGLNWRLAECQWKISDPDDICGQKATDVDHIRRGDDHRDSNLQSLCGMHHRRKSSSEGGEGNAVNRRKIDASFRREEDHPGII